MRTDCSAGRAAHLSRAIVALALVGFSGCASVSPKTDSATDGAKQQMAGDPGAIAARFALGLVGIPYRYGGNTPKGFDCSGLVQYTYALAGIQLPRSVDEQLARTRAISRTRIRPGDLLVFHLNSKPNSHIGLYIGNGSFVHAPSTGKLVSTASLSNPYWRRRLAGARRLHFD